MERADGGIPLDSRLHSSVGTTQVPNSAIGSSRRPASDDDESDDITASDENSAESNGSDSFDTATAGEIDLPSPSNRLVASDEDSREHLRPPSLFSRDQMEELVNNALNSGGRFARTRLYRRWSMLASVGHDSDTSDYREDASPEITVTDSGVGRNFQTDPVSPYPRARGMLFPRHSMLENMQFAPCDDHGFNCSSHLPAGGDAGVSGSFSSNLSSADDASSDGFGSDSEVPLSTSDDEHSYDSGESQPQVFSPIRPRRISFSQTERGNGRGSQSATFPLDASSACSSFSPVAVVERMPPFSGARRIPRPPSTTGWQLAGAPSGSSTQYHCSLQRGQAKSWMRRCSWTPSTSAIGLSLFQLSHVHSRSSW